VTSRGWRRLIAWSLFGVGFVAMVAHTGEFERMDGWAWLSLPTLAAAPFVGFRGGMLRWLLASIPFWIYGNASEPILLSAVGVTIGGLAVGAVLPTLPSRRVRSPTPPLAYLAAGPLVPVTPRHFSGGKRSRFLTWATRFLVAAALASLIAAALGTPAEVWGTICLVSLIMSATFAFSNWFADRVHFRIDGIGVHGRTLFREQTARWNEITGLNLRYLFMPGHGIRVVYYVVESAETEVSFPSSMAGAKELQTAVEAATGLQWPEPEITPTM
jgi:hypothetical protein